MKIEPFVRYVNRSGDICVPFPNFTGWLDHLPWAVQVVQGASIATQLGLGSPQYYTCDDEGRVYQNKEDPYDLLKKEKSNGLS